MGIVGHQLANGEGLYWKSGEKKDTNREIGVPRKPAFVGLGCAPENTI